MSKTKISLLKDGTIRIYLFAKRKNDTTKDKDGTIKAKCLKGKMTQYELKCYKIYLLNILFSQIFSLILFYPLVQKFFYFIQILQLYWIQ